jgi:hypothetical protein
MSTAWNNAVKATTNFIGRAITGIALWSDVNAMWSDPLFTWGDIGIAYTNEQKSMVVIPASSQPFGAWLFFFTIPIAGSISPIAWNYETKH